MFDREPAAKRLADHLWDDDPIRAHHRKTNQSSYPDHSAGRYPHVPFHTLKAILFVAAIFALPIAAWVLTGAK